MYKHGVDDWILDETELAEHYKDIGKPEGYERKMELVGLLEQLKEYKQLEEQGILIKLPCKVGDSIYSVIEDGLTIVELKFSLNFYVRRKNDFGKTVFLTKSEAEAKLKELRGNDNGK